MYFYPSPTFVFLNTNNSTFSSLKKVVYNKCMSISVCVFVCLSVDRACAKITRPRPIYYKFSHNFYFIMYCLCQNECTRKGFCIIQKNGHHLQTYILFSHSKTHILICLKLTKHIIQNTGLYQFSTCFIFTGS